MAELRQNTWSLNAWYEQDYAGNVDYESTLSEFFTFGVNTKGQLGQNNVTHYSSPTQVPGTTWSHMSTANNNDSYHMIATRTDGTLWSWGSNNNGQYLALHGIAQNYQENILLHLLLKLMEHYGHGDGMVMDN